MPINDASLLLATLRSAGLKITPQRMAIAECLAGDATHPTAQELYERLRERFPSMSVATVYNTLSALDSVGHCRRLEMGGAIRFDPNVAPHDHAVCERCGAIRDVAIGGGIAPALGGGAMSGAAGEGDEPRPCDLPGFRVDRVERIYRGVCARCADAA
jgi:Fur family peroxide stress response transcriptional regulator